MPNDLKIYALDEAGVNNLVSSMAQPPSGGSGMGGLEARVAKIEATVEHVQTDVREIKSDIRDLRTASQTDFRIVFGSLIAVALGLAGLMAHGFHWL